MRFNSRTEELLFFAGRARRHLRHRYNSWLRPLRSYGNVLMIHTGRSGSTLLGDMLDQHPDLFWDGETIEKMFHHNARRKGERVREQTGQYDIAHALAHLDRRRKRLGGPLVFGSEIQDTQLEMLGTRIESFIEGAKSQGFSHFILLDRRHQLRKIVSHVAAYEREAHHVPSGTRAPRPVLHLDPRCFFLGYTHRDMLQTLDGWSDFFRRAQSALHGQHVLHLTYEDDLEHDPAIAYGKICRFLGLQPASPAIRFGKTGDYPLSAMLSNYAEVSAYLAGTPYDWMAPKLEADGSTPRLHVVGKCA